MGNPCDIDEIQNISDQYNLKLIEDCCEALGAKFNGKHVGNFGIAGTFSFYFSHHITTMEGGMVISNDEENMDELRELRSHGWNRDSSRKNDYLNNSIDVDLRYLFTNYGFNLRPTELQAGFGIHQLAKLDAFTRKRQLLSKIFFEYIDNSSYFHFPKVHPKATPCWFALPLIVSEKASFSKDEFCDYLEKAGVETRPIVTGNFAKQPIAVMLGLKDSDYPGANIIHSRGFYIGLSPMLEENHIYRLIDLFDTFIKKKHG